MATFTNRATLSYNGKTTDSNPVTGTIRQTLSVTKDAVIGEYSRGDNIVYAISLVNSGVVAFTDLSVTDDLGAFNVGTQTVYPLTYVADSVQYYINGVLQSDPAVEYDDTLTLGGISVPAGANAMIIYIATVNDSAPIDIGDSIENTVTVSGDCIATPITATETITAVESPELTITKALSPTTVIENGRVTYTFTIQNYGNTAAVATDDATVTDDFDPILRDIVVTYEGDTWTEGVNYNYNHKTGLFATVAGEITVPAATFERDDDNNIVITPGSVVLTVTGTI